MNYINTFFNCALHLLYPKICAGCGSDLIEDDQVICIDCISDLPLTNFHMHPGNVVEKIFWGRLQINAAASFVYFNKGSVVQRLLHQLKYKGNKEIGLYFGRRMGDLLQSIERFKDVDALIPLPLHPEKKKIRGYNQASVICEGMATAMKVPVLEEVISRTTKTDTQTKKNRVERWQNTAGKFETVNASSINNTHVMLVDDVITTGATLEACGRELLNAGNVKLSIASLAYTSI